MIQRIQSVFLLLVALVMIAVVFLPMWVKIDAGVQEMVTLNAFQLEYAAYDESGEKTIMAIKDTFWVAVLALAAAGIALFSIFQYTNRLRQIQLGALNSLVMGGCLGVTYYFSTIGARMLPTEGPGTFQEGFYIIAAALLFNTLANRFIRKDEKLVRSADRIR